MKECQNCGMPMVKNEDFGNSDPKSVLCRLCFSDKSADEEKKARVPEKEIKIIELVDLDRLDSGDLF
ncbi:MAG: zinc ribbon domain-containing protein [Candidatus Paceibacterota bacterium]|jgi:hypothetical protein